MNAKPVIVTGPYKGLVPYSEEDAAFFFGRDTDRKVITANLLGSRLTLLYGVSGAGKSSVLNAGVAYHLRQLATENREIGGAPELAVVVFDAWREDPLSSLLGKVQVAVKESLDADEDLPSPEPSDLCTALHWWCNRLDGDLLIILDQFEEYLRSQKEGRDTFATGFVRAVNAPNLRVNFLISIREDALAQLDRFKGKVPGLFGNYLRLDHLDLKAAKEAIVKPVEEWSRRPYHPGPRVLEQPLVEEILKQIPSNTGPTYMTRPGQASATGERRIEASVLQVVMTRLWDDEVRAGSSILRLETLQNLGNSNKIFDDYLEDRLRELPQEDKETVGNIFLHLVDREGIRSPAAAQDLADRTKIPLYQIEPALVKLKERGVLVVRSSGTNTTRFEVPHDILGFAILRWRQQFEEHRKAARLRWFSWGWAALGFTLLALVIGLPLWNQRVEQRRHLANAERLAAKALYYSNRRLDLGLLLAAQAARTADSGEVRNGLLSTLQQVPRLKAFLYGDPGGINSLAFDSAAGRLAAGTADGQVRFWTLAQMKSEAPLPAHASGTRVSGLAFYRDKAGVASLATAGEDGAIYLWDLLRRRPQALIEPRSELERRSRGFSSLTLSSDGRFLAAGVVNGRVLLWDLQSRQRPRSLEPRGGEWPVVVFTPNGRILAVGSADGAVRLYDSSGVLLTKLSGEAGSITSLTTGPYGKLLAAGTRTGKVLLWRLQDRRLLSGPVTAHAGGPVWSLAFDPMNPRLATGGADRRIRLWTWSKESPDLKADGDPLTGGHDAGVRGLVFSDNGQTLASGGEDGRVCLWSVEETPPLGTRLARMSGSIEGLSFSPDGQFLASDGSDGHVHLWDLTQKKPINDTVEEEALWSLAFSPDGSMVAAGGESGKVRLWRLRGNPSLLLNPHHGRGIEGLAFSPNGAILAWADLDWTIQLWNLRQKRLLPMLTGHTAGVWDIAFSPDGKNLASGGEDQTVRIWDPEGGKQIGHPLAEHSKGVVAVAYSHDGKILASGGLDGKILLWDPRHQKLIGPMFGSHSGGVSDVAFSPDGTLLASSGQDGHVRLWSPLTRQPLGDPLGGHHGEVKSLAFRPDGRALASGGSDGDLFLWDVDLDSWLSRACAKANRNMSMDEWRQLVDPEARYKKTCPDLPAGEGVSPGKG